MLIEEVIGALEAPPPGDDGEDLFDLDTLQEVVWSVCRGDALDEILERFGISEDELFGTLAQLGTWLSHVHRPPTDFEVVPDRRRAAQPRLFPFDGAKVRLGQGLRPPAKKAVTAIAVTMPDRRELLRFLDRHSHLPMRVTGRELVLVWVFARLGRLHEVPQVLANPFTRRSLASALRMVHRELQLLPSRVVEMVDPGSPPERVAELAARLAWVDEAETARLERLAGLSEKALRLRQRSLRKEAGYPPWRVEGLHSLTLPQALRLFAALGYQLGDAGISKLVSEIRSRIRAAGQAEDADILLPLGLAAWEAGEEEAFLESLAARRRGDPDWASALAGE